MNKLEILMKGKQNELKNLSYEILLHQINK